jgi:hypothetical protein
MSRAFMRGLHYGIVWLLPRISGKEKYGSAGLRGNVLRTTTVGYLNCPSPSVLSTRGLVLVLLLLFLLRSLGRLGRYTDIFQENLISVLGYTATFSIRAP